MPTKKQTSYVNVAAASPVPASVSMPVPAYEVLMGNDLPGELQRQIAQETGIDLAIIEAMDLKRAVAHYVAQRAGLGTLERVDEFLALSHPLVSKERPQANQKQFQETYQKVLEAHINTLIAINTSTNNAVTTIAARPISRPQPPEPKPQEEVYIDRAPGFWGFLSGDLQITRVRKR